MNWPRLSVVLYTHMARPERFEYAKRTLQSVAARLSYSGPVSFHIADDNSPEPRLFDLRHIAKELEAKGAAVTMSRAGGKGYGGSYNLSSQQVHNRADVILPLEDDWELLRPFDVSEYVGVLSDERVNVVRLGYLGWTQPLRGEVIRVGSTALLLFDPDSPERHVMAGHPRLETVAYQRAVGPWPEGLDAGTTEFEVAGREAARKGVCWPLGLAPHSLFAHIGSVQAREDQR